MPRVRSLLTAGALTALGVGIGLPLVGSAQQPPETVEESRPDRIPPKVTEQAKREAEKIEARAKNPPPPAVLKIYDVSDLVDRRLREVATPNVMPPSVASALSYQGNGVHGGVFVSSENGGRGERDDERLDVGDISSLIEREADPEVFWEGNHRIEVIGSKIVVRHTPAVHENVRKILDELRTAHPHGKSIEAVAHWVLLNPADVPALYKANSREIDLAKLNHLPAGVLYARSAVRTLTGQATVLNSGRASTAITAVDSSVGYAVAAYNPTTAHLLSGAMLELRAAVDDKWATIDLTASLGDRDQPDKPATLRSIRGSHPITVKEENAEKKTVEQRHFDPVGGSDTTAEIDRLNTVTAHLQTRARLPLGKPVLVGGMTLEPATGATISKGDPRQLYLILEVNLAE